MFLTSQAAAAASWPSARLWAASCTLFSLIVSGCMTSAQRHGDPIPAEELARQDPDPDKEMEGPPFCNPTGKSGQELATCHAQNEAYYSVFDDEAKKREPWFNFIPDSWASAPLLDAQDVLPVVRLDEAIGKLEKTAWLELAPADVQFYTGKSRPKDDGLKAYLVRALVYYPNTGAFSVFHKNDAIFVRHDSIGKEMPSEKRSAVVVFLGFTPKQVFVDCSVSE